MTMSHLRFASRRSAIDVLLIMLVRGFGSEISTRLSRY
jgi:hypothetical protein